MLVQGLKKSTFATGCLWARQIHSGEVSKWPTAKDPSPFDIFGIPRGGAIDPSELKRTYLQLAKLYHPDSSSQIAITRKEQTDRFKKIVAAYGILRDPIKRRAFETHTTTHQWPPRYPHTYYQNRHAYYNEQYDFYGYDTKAESRKYDKEFQEQLNQNRYKMSVLVGLVALFLGALQVQAIFKMSEKNLDEYRELSYRARLDELNAQKNYGMGSMRDERIARFLATRETGSYYNKYDASPSTDQLALPAPKNA
ncbi:hypothetical protein TRVA0_001S06414 [Trichomonascus vanleenenianus]|uniref:Jid1p n=1 Tax=Trichomonascus vanleenenianus TaxID=2268995 RepID=UPI003ECA290D